MSCTDLQIHIHTHRISQQHRSDTTVPKLKDASLYLETPQYIGTVCFCVPANLWNIQPV